MGKYRFVLTAEFDVDAINVMHAHRIARKRIRAMGECVSYKFYPGARDGIASVVELVSERISLKGGY